MCTGMLRNDGLRGIYSLILRAGFKFHGFSSAIDERRLWKEIKSRTSVTWPRVTQLYFDHERD